MTIKMKKYRKILILLVLLIILVTAVYILGLKDYLTFERLQVYKAGLRQYVEHHYWISVLWFTIAYMLLAGLSVPGTAVLTMAGGYVYGVLQAAIYVDIGATLGATTAFLLSRYLVGKWVRKRYQKNLEEFDSQFKSHGIYYLLTLRLAPVLPFTRTNLFSGPINIRVFSYMWTTALGILPVTLLYSAIGKQLGHIETPGDLQSPGVWIAFFLLGLFALLPLIYKRMKKSKASSD